MAKSKDTALAELAELGSALADVVEDTEKKNATLKSILDVIGELDPDDAKALFKNEKIQRLIEVASTDLTESSDDPPGTIRPGMIGGQVVAGFIKKPWNEADLMKLIAQGKMELIRGYRPLTSQPVIWNGLRRNFQARRPIDVPACFVYVYEQSLNETELGEQHAAFLFKKTNVVSDWSIVNENGIRMRGTGSDGHYIPGGGLVTMGDEAVGG